MVRLRCPLCAKSRHKVGDTLRHLRISYHASARDLRAQGSKVVSGSFPSVAADCRVYANVHQPRRGQIVRRAQGTALGARPANFTAVDTTMLFTGALSLNPKNDRSTDPVTASDLTDQTGILGQKRTLCPLRWMSAFPPIADIAR